MAHVYPTHKLVFSITPKTPMGTGKSKRLFDQFFKGQDRQIWHDAELIEKGYNPIERTVWFTFVANNNQELGDKVAACQRLISYVWFATPYPVNGYEIFELPMQTSVVKIGIARK